MNIREKIYNNPKRALLIAIFTVLALGFLVYIFTHSLITIQGVGDGEKTVYLENVDDGEGVQNFTLTDNSRTFLVPKGFYVVRVVGPNKQSLYERDLVGASLTKVEVRLEEQKKQFALGKSFFDCSLYEKPVATAVFYPCASYNGTLENQKSGGGVKTLFNPLVGRILEGQHNHGHTDEETALQQPGSALVPYQDGFLSAVSNKRGLSIKRLGSDGSLSRSPTLEVSDFQGTANNYTFSAINDGRSSIFSVLDEGSQSLMIFDDANDKKPDRFGLAEELAKNKEVQLIRTALSKDFAFIFLSRAPDDTEDHSFLDQNTESTDEQFETGQEVLVLDIRSGEIVKKQEIPQDVRIGNILASPGGVLALLPVFGEGRSVYLLSADSYEVSSLPQDNIKDLCWKDSTNFYYSVAYSEEIYERSVKENASFLKYKNPISAIRNIDCVAGDLYFALDNSRDGTGNLYHYLLTDQEQTSGVRVENLLPLYLSVAGDTLKLVAEGDSVRVEQAVDSDGNPSTPDQKTARKAVLSRLKQQDADVQGLNLIFNY